jgi:hypothetical protein
MAKKPASKPQASPSRRATVPPVNVIKLMDEIGGTRTAAKLGVSTTLLYKAKNENSISQVVESAAAHALATLGQSERPTAYSGHDMYSPGGRQRTGDALFMVTVPGDKIDVFQRMATALGAIAVPA